MHAFRAAVESGDISTIGDLFTDDAILHSPIAYRPYQGRRSVATVITAVANVFDGLRYRAEMCADRTGDHALDFTAKVDDLEIEGCDFIHTRPDGLIDEITVMLRPLRAVSLFAEKMRAELARA